MVNRVYQARQAVSFTLGNERHEIVVALDDFQDTRFGSGLLEKAYRVILATELKRLGHKVEEEKVCGFSYNGQDYQNMFRVDLLVDDTIVVELKSVSRREPVFAKQCLTYLRLLDKDLGFVINFGVPSLKDGVERVVNNIQKDFADVANFA